MTPFDLYFQTTSRADFLDDLLALQLARAVAEAQVLPADGVVLDYVGQLVQTPAVLDTGTFPPTITTPATFYSGDRVNLRLTGHDAETRALALAAATLAHSTLLSPADVPPAQKRWSGGGEPWDGQASVPVSPPAPGLDLATQKTRLLARLAQRRWEVETAGVAVSGVPVETDRASQAMLTGALTYLTLYPAAAPVRWKTPAGFVDLDVATLQSIAGTVGAHVQACFAHEADLSAAIQAAPDAPTLAALTSQVESFTP